MDTLLMTPASLLPENLFTDSAEWLLWLMVAAAIPALAFGADRLVEAAVRIARAMGIPTVIIGATIVSLGTTTPECVVSVRAAISGSPDMALGNAVGSIICDTALIFGLCCLLTRLPLDRAMLNRQGLVQFFSGLLLGAIAFGSWLLADSMQEVYIGRTVGLALLGLLAAYLWLSIAWSRRGVAGSAVTLEMIEDTPEEAAATRKAAARHPAALLATNLLLLVFGLAAVVVGSELLIGAATEICSRRHVPQAVIAVTLVAFGTSLPELVTALAAVAKKHPELLVGNIVGADILNVLFVVGASATATPLKVEPVFFKLLLPVMMLVLLLLRVYVVATRGDRFHRWQGIPLLAVYATFLAISILVFGIVG